MSRKTLVLLYITGLTMAMAFQNCSRLQSTQTASQNRNGQNSAEAANNGGTTTDNPFTAQVQVQLSPFQAQSDLNLCVTGIDVVAADGASVPATGLNFPLVIPVLADGSTLGTLHIPHGTYQQLIMHVGPGCAGSPASLSLQNSYTTLNSSSTYNLVFNGSIEATGGATATANLTIQNQMSAFDQAQSLNDILLATQQPGSLSYMMQMMLETLPHTQRVLYSAANCQGALVGTDVTAPAQFAIGNTWYMVEAIQTPLQKPFASVLQPDGTCVNESGTVPEYPVMVMPSY